MDALNVAALHAAEAMLAQFHVAVAPQNANNLWEQELDDAPIHQQMQLQQQNLLHQDELDALDDFQHAPDILQQHQQQQQQQQNLFHASSSSSASSLLLHPSHSFFSSLRIGQGVDCLDLIGHPQWRHAVVLEARNDAVAAGGQQDVQVESYWKVRWSGWDAKWDEWVHCLRLAPAHTKVLGDSGPDDSNDKTLTTVLGAEWFAFLRENKNKNQQATFADVRIAMEGKTPWRSVKERNDSGGVVNRSAPPVSLPPRPSLASLDPDEDESGESFSSLNQASASSSTSSSSHPIFVTYAHDIFLRTRCPRLFKYERDSNRLYEENISVDGTSKTTNDSSLLSSPPASSRLTKSASTSPSTSDSASNTISTQTTRLSKSVSIGTIKAQTVTQATMTSVNTSTKTAATQSAGAQSARMLSRQLSASSLTGASTTRVTKPRKNSASALSSSATHHLKTPSRTVSTSTPTSPPMLSHSFSATSTAAKVRQNSITAASAASSSVTSSRIRSPNISAPSTPKLVPSLAPKLAKLAASTNTTPAASPRKRGGAPPVASTSLTSPKKRPSTGPRLGVKRSQRTSSTADDSTLAPLPASALSKINSPFSDPFASSDIPEPELLALPEASSTATSVTSVSPSISVTPPPPHSHTNSFESISSAVSSTAPSVTEDDEPDVESKEIEIAKAAILRSEENDPDAVSPSPEALPSVALETEAAILLPTSPIISPTPSVTEQQPVIQPPAPQTQHPSPPQRPAFKTLILPLSSVKAVHALIEYIYTDNIIHTALGVSDGVKERDEAMTSERKGKKGKKVGKGDSTSTSSSSAMILSDLFELACLASNLHDTRLMCLCALHIQHLLSQQNIMDALDMLYEVDALSIERTQVLSVFLNGCLAPPVVGKEEKERATYLQPDTPATFLRSHLNICGVASHDFDILSRIILEYIALNWNKIFTSSSTATTLGANNGGGVSSAQSSSSSSVPSAAPAPPVDPLVRLHSFPFHVFSLVVSLRDGVSYHGGSGVGNGANGSQHVFKSIEEKAIYNQAQINAALIVAGMQPNLHQNFFTNSLFSITSALHPTHEPPPHSEVLRMIASPSISIPPCNLVKALKKMYEARSEETCDVRIVIEDDSMEAAAVMAQENDSSSVSSSSIPSKPSRPVIGVLWAHKLILSCGSSFFRTYFCSPSSSTWSRSSEDDTPDERGITTIRFPSSAHTIASMEAVLRFIYYNEQRQGIDFFTALYLMNQRVTNYFGLREYGNGVEPSASSAASAIASLYAPIPSSFVSDLEKSCIQYLHTSLATSLSSASSSSASASSTLPDCLSLLHSAYLYGDRSLFEKATILLDYTHLDLLMTRANKRRRDEEEKRKLDVVRQEIHEMNQHNASHKKGKKKKTKSTTSAAAASRRALRTGDEDEHEHEPHHDDNDDLLTETDSDLEDERIFGTPPPPSELIGPSSSAQFEFIAAIIAEKARSSALSK